uniref:glucose-6-phosphate 1-epimerase n=1 Tax=Corethron hystrix TaxID=216773 RepID=A0A7S1G0X4_9STRA|mmetsp:Transcript_6905/g.14908  ORF Transcript_6905/g.14908 Transcript_6905/m.14908 type:complete len:300 (+) Transcript_6905:44-943(+)
MSNDPILIKHTASGASAKVLPFGATIISFLNSKGHETLFLSSLAKTDGSKATRGGIPLVFPQFGQPNKDMPQHGFLRNNYWKCGDFFDHDEEAGIDFTLALGDVVNARGEGVWKDGGTVDCSIVLSIKVTANSLTTVLTIKNTGENIFDFQTLFHTYFKIYGSKALDKIVCNITGLAGYHIYDQVRKEERVQSEEPLFVDSELDCIFTAPDGKPSLDVLICTGDDGSKVSVQASAYVDGEAVAVSAVVWNPFIEKSKRMGDYADSEYHDMICVEPGVLRTGQKLLSGKKIGFLQKITTL